MKTSLNIDTNKLNRFKLFLILLFFLVGRMFTIAQVQVYGSGNNKFQSYSSGGTSSGAATNGTLKLFAVMGQPMATSNSVLTQLQSGMLSAASNGVLVTDKVSPKITANQASTVLNKGTSNANSFSLTVSDNISVASVRISYKKLMAPSSSFVNANLEKSTTSNAYSVTVQDSWYDDMGLEYFYTATDRAGNSTRDPITGSYFTYLKDPAATLPASSYSIGNKISNYRIIALPYVSESGEDINTVFGTSSGLPTFSTAKDIWRLGTYDTPTQTFLEYPSSLTTLNRGKGYWFILNRQVDQISFGAKVSPSNTRNNLYKISLKTGWNMVGNPYPTKINWSDVQQFQGNPVIGDLSTWNGGWSLVTDWAAFQGGYINSPADGELSIPFVGQAKIGGKSTNSSLNSDISANQWQVELHIFQESAFNKLGRFGMINSPTVSNEFKSFNPPPVENSPEVNFTTDKLCRMMVPTAANYTWTFEASGEVGRETELVWSSGLGSGAEGLYLFDNISKRLVNMKAVNSYSFTLENNHTFKLFFGSNESNLIINEIIVSKPYPNPTQHRNTFFLLVLPDSNSSFEVNIKLIGANGALINDFNTVVGAGVQTIDLKFDEAINAGLYYYRISVSSNQISHTETGKLVIQ